MTADLLRLTQWLSPAFPLSGYAYSHGLETAMAEGRVHDAETCRAWVETVLARGTGALDAWAIRVVMAGAEPAPVADTLRARAGCAERWSETRDMGEAFGRTLDALEDRPDARWPLPVALALRARGMEADTVIALYLHAFAAQIVSAATRFLPLGQVEGQGVLASLHALITELSARDQTRPPGSAALLAERDAMAHETLSTRLFRT